MIKYKSSDQRHIYYALILMLFIFVSIPYTTKAVTVGPVKIEYSIDPGAIVSGEMFIKNEERLEKTFYPSIELFTEQNGQKLFPKEHSLINDWLSTESSVTLKPGEGMKVPFTITIPNNAPPGGQFAVIWWGNVPPKSNASEQDVSIQTRAGILVYLNISGDITENASILFSTFDNSSFFGSASVPFDLTVKNEGNVYIKPTGSLKITSLFGNTVTEIPVNAKQLQILPKSFRTYNDMSWQGSRFSFGPYKSEIKVFYGSDNKFIVSSKWIWIFPIKLISITVLITIGLFVGIQSFFKMYNKRLLKKFAAENKK